MWAWKRTSLYLAAVTCLLVGAADSYGEGFQTFLMQHQDNPKMKTEDADYCDVLMASQHLTRLCKPFHIFVHASEAQLQAVCRADGYPYHGTGKRRSKTSYPITLCRLGMRTKYQQCIYYTSFSNRHLILSCDGNDFPVLLDEVLTMGR
ncbi:ribonuclease pancreatic-like [Paroedura picta]|uniref:ribonuclease pancreatic-like n=1 Tax=Paroedura picta TaxID=143630 RepID=UPI0040576AEF